VPTEKTVMQRYYSLVLMLFFAYHTSRVLCTNCYAQMMSRGFGAIPGSCPPPMVEQDLLCYEPCKTGYYGEGPLCWSYCNKTGYSDWGVFCMPDITEAKTNGCPWYDECGLFTDCSVCPEGYSAEGCLCSYNGDPFMKQTYSRGVGELGGCGPGMVEDLGLCYPPCPKGWTGVGPVCWRDCAVPMSECGPVCIAPDPSGKYGCLPFMRDVSLALVDLGWTIADCMVRLGSFCDYDRLQRDIYLLIGELDLPMCGAYEDKYSLHAIDLSRMSSELVQLLAEQGFNITLLA